MSNTSLPSADVQRLFEMQGDTLLMYSKLSSEFGDLILVNTIDLLPVFHEKDEDGYPSEPASLRISQFLQVGRNEDLPFEFRLGEMHYFLKIASLFNPKNRTDYGLPQTQTDLP